MSKTQDWITTLRYTHDELLEFEQFPIQHDKNNDTILSKVDEIRDRIQDISNERWKVWSQHREKEEVEMTSKKALLKNRYQNYMVLKTAADYDWKIYSEKQNERQGNLKFMLPFSFKYLYMLYCFYIRK